MFIMKNDAKKKPSVKVRIAVIPLKNVEEIKKILGNFMANQMQKRLI